MINATPGRDFKDCRIVLRARWTKARFLRESERLGQSHPRGSSESQGQVYSYQEVVVFNQSKASDSSLLRDNKK